MSVVPHSLYLRERGCCKIVEVCTPGPQGPQGEIGIPGTGNITTALLFYDNITFGEPSGAYLTYSESNTSANGYSYFVNSSGELSFSSLPPGSLIEIYCHCDANSSSSGSSNYITINLREVSGSANPLQIVDLDTRSVQKSTTSHLTFGPTSYKIVSDSVSSPLSIHNDNVYKLFAEVGKPYTLEELKLVIKVIYVPPS